MQKKTVSLYTPRNIKIAASAVIFISILGLMYSYNWSIKPRDDCEGECIAFRGNVSVNWNLSISDLYGNYFMREENVEFDTLNSVGTEDKIIISGVRLYDIFYKLNFLNDSAEYIIFKSQDGFASPKLPISIIRDNPEAVILATHIDGIFIKNKTQGGNGPILPYVSLDAIKNNDTMLKIFEEDLSSNFVYNTIYKAKFLSRIEVI